MSSYNRKIPETNADVKMPDVKPPVKKRVCKVINNILFYAFRYAVKRTTAAASEVCDSIKNNIQNFEDWEIKQMIKEIDLECNLEMMINREWLELYEYLEDYLNQ